MAKHLRVITEDKRLEGVKKSEVVSGDVGGLSPGGHDPSAVKFIKTHKTEKHADRAGNKDDVYKGKTKREAHKRAPNADDNVNEAQLDELHKVLRRYADATSWDGEYITHDRDYARLARAKLSGKKTYKTDFDGERPVKVPANPLEPKQVGLRRSKKQANEETQIDEISKKTLNSYVKKADADRKKLRTQNDLAAGTGFLSPDTEAKNWKKSWNRSDGIKSAEARIKKTGIGKFYKANEETELAEVSAEKLGRYIKKAVIDKEVSRDDLEFYRHHRDDAAADQSGRRMDKRTKGLKTAVNKLTGGTGFTQARHKYAQTWPAGNDREIYVGNRKPKVMAKEETESTND